MIGPNAHMIQELKVVIQLLSLNNIHAPIIMALHLLLICAKIG